MRVLRVTLGICAVAVPALLVAGSARATRTSADRAADEAALRSVVQHPFIDLCPAVPAGRRRCFAKKRTDVFPAAGAQGYGPPDLQSAYAISAMSTGTVAIVDAFDNPTAEQDLGVYRQNYGLPACTSANGCFRKVNQNGQPGPYPTPDPNWAGEMALDLDMVSAGCPACKIILVEVNSDQGNDLDVGQNTAASLGVDAISNSWGGPEDGTVQQQDDQYFNHPGILITVASGDQGFGVQYPASSAMVLAVGGTTLSQSGSSRGWAESAWNGGGSGCSAFIAKPSWQTDPGCTMRMEADVSAVADPNTGVAVYDTNNGGWIGVGGTSAATPLVAAILVAAGKAKLSAGFVYAHAQAFYDVTSGSNGTCSPSYECTAQTAYDGPTGIGTPNGTALASIMPCTSSAMCPPMQPICDTTSQTCRACTASDCSGATPICETSGSLAGECVQCDASHTSACTGMTPICDSGTGKCRACTASDCTGAKAVCSTSGGAAGTCVQCDSTNHSACTGGTPICDGTSDTCRACTGNADCASGQVCDTSSDALGGQCVQCNTNADCSGATCNVSTHTCSSGNPFGGGGDGGGGTLDGGSSGNPFGGGSDGGGNGAGPGNDGSTTSSTSCSCRAAGGGGGSSGLWLAALLGLAVATRRRGK